jgi:cytochrome P450
MASTTAHPPRIEGTESRLDPAIRNDPFPFYKALREQRPVYYDPGLDVWLVTRYDDARAVLADSGTYSLEHGYQDRYANGHVEELAEILDREGGGFIRDLAIDPPAHTRLRKLTEKAFTAHRVKSLEPRIRQIVIDLIEPLAEKGWGDGMLDIGAPLTAHLICEQLGMDWDAIGTAKVAKWTTAIIAQIGRMQTREEMIENAHIIADLQRTIIAEIEERQRQLREDMISDLVTARIEGEDNPALDFRELVATVRAFLIAGNDTTAAGIANLLHVLATNEGLADRMLEHVDNDRVMGRFVEEVMRLHPPVHGLFRTAMKDVEIGGVAIPAMSQICVMYASANYDEARFADPETLDVDRPNVGANLTFGSGIHKCVGIALARMEVKVAAQEFIRRLTDIRLAVPEEELTFLPTLATHTFEKLPLTFRRREG